MQKEELVDKKTINKPEEKYKSKKFDKVRMWVMLLGAFLYCVAIILNKNLSNYHYLGNRLAALGYWSGLAVSLAVGLSKRDSKVKKIIAWIGAVLLVISGVAALILTATRK